jgi:GTPase SAR1 family protein
MTKLLLNGGGICSVLFGLYLAGTSANPELKIDEQNLQEFSSTGKLEVVKTSNKLGFYLGSSLVIGGFGLIAYNIFLDGVMGSKSFKSENGSQENSENDFELFEVSKPAQLAQTPQSAQSNLPSDIGSKVFQFPDMDLGDFNILPKLGEGFGDIVDAVKDVFDDNFESGYVDKITSDLLEVDFAKFASQINMSLAIMGTPDSGKTSLLRHLTYNWLVKTRGNLDLSIVDCKSEDSGFMGLEKGSRYSRLTRYDEIENFEKLIGDALLKTSQPKASKPTLLIIDEINNGYGTIKNSDRIQKTGRFPVVQTEILQIATKGRSKDILSVLTSHSPSYRDLGISRDNSYSFYFAFIADAGKLDSIYDQLTKSDSLIANTIRRKELLNQLDRFSRLNSDKCKICLSNIPTNNGSDWQIYKLPNYSPIPDLKSTLSTFTRTVASPRGV